MARSFKVLSPTAILGYGFPEESFRKAMAESPDLIAVDAGSSDPGPHYLGAGKPFTDRAGVKRDLRYMITAGVQNNIPVVIGTAGGSGAAPHLEWCREIIHEIAQEEHLSFSMALIPADVDKAIVHQALDNGKITALEFVPPLTHDAIDESTYIVAQKARKWCWAGALTTRPALLRFRSCKALMKVWRCIVGKSLNARQSPQRPAQALTVRWASLMTTALR